MYSGGLHEDRLQRSIEAALTTKDEFGRVQTPKERFRRLCHECVRPACAAAPYALHTQLCPSRPAIPPSQQALFGCEPPPHTRCPATNGVSLATAALTPFVLLVFCCFPHG